MTGTPTANAVTAIELAFRNARRPPLVAALVAAEVVMVAARVAGGAVTAFPEMVVARRAAEVVMPFLERMVRSLSRARVVRMRAASVLMPSCPAIWEWVLFW